jgi:hypothetical protein
MARKFSKKACTLRGKEKFQVPLDPTVFRWNVPNSGLFRPFGFRLQDICRITNTGDAKFMFLWVEGAVIDGNPIGIGIEKFDSEALRASVLQSLAFPGISRLLVRFASIDVNSCLGFHSNQVPH